MRHAYHVARLTFVDALRNKALHGVLVFAVGMLLAATALTSVTMGRPALMIHDVGMGMMSLLANLMAVIFVIQDLQQDKANRTLYVLMGRLPRRFVYILGKFLGMSALIAVAVAGMYASLAVLVSVFGGVAWSSSIAAFMGTIVEVMVVVALALVMAQGSSFFLAMVMTLALDVAGRYLSIIQQAVGQSDNPMAQGLVWVVVHVLPDFERLSLRRGAGYPGAFDVSMVADVWFYGAMEVAILLVLAMLIFERRNLS